MRAANITLLTTVALVACLAGPASADLIAINFDFGRDCVYGGKNYYTTAPLNTETGPAHALNNGTGAIATNGSSIAETTWNQVTGSFVNRTLTTYDLSSQTGGSVTLTGELKVSAGNTTTIGWTTAAEVPYGFTYTGALDGVWNNNVMKDYVYGADVGGKPVGFRLSGLDAGLYDVYVVAAVFSGTTYYHQVSVGKNLNTLTGSTYIDGYPNTEANWNAANNGNYFKGTVAIDNASDWLTALVRNAAGGTDLNAIQIVQTIAKAQANGGGAYELQDGGSVGLSASIINAADAKTITAWQWDFDADHGAVSGLSGATPTLDYSAIESYLVDDTCTIYVRAQNAYGWSEWAPATVNVVPEPATLGLLALGGLSMLGAAVRRRRQA